MVFIRAANGTLRDSLNNPSDIRSTVLDDVIRVIGSLWTIGSPGSGLEVLKEVPAWFAALGIILYSTHLSEYGHSSSAFI